MHGGVAELAEQVEQDTGRIDGEVVCARGEGARVVDGQGAQQARDNPVEAAVLEDVAGRHGVGGELVHEEGLELALGEVQRDEPQREGLQVGGRARGGRAVDGGPQEVDQRVDEQGPEVFDQEDGAPGDLGAC